MLVLDMLAFYPAILTDAATCASLTNGVIWGIPRLSSHLPRTHDHAAPHTAPYLSAVPTHIHTLHHFGANSPPALHCPKNAHIHIHIHIHTLARVPHPGGLSEEEAFRLALSTWPPGIRPVVHWSESQRGRRPHAHSDYVNGPIYLYGKEQEVGHQLCMTASAHVKAFCWLC